MTRTRAAVMRLVVSLAFVACWVPASNAEAGTGIGVQASDIFAVGEQIPTFPRGTAALSGDFRNASVQFSGGVATVTIRQGGYARYSDYTYTCDVSECVIVGQEVTRGIVRREPTGGGTNRAPRTTGSIPAQVLTVGGSAASVNVAQYFTDPDGDALTYTARSSRTGIVTAAVLGATVTFRPVAAGTATVTVTAHDPGGLSVTQSIAVTVEDDGGTNRAPQATGSIPAQTLTVGGRAASVNIAQYFSDPDGDALTYTASSSRTGIVMAVLSGNTVTLTPVTAGTAMVTVTARDPGGLSATQSIAVTVEDDGGTNRAPQAIGSIPAQTLTAGGRAASVNIAQYFSDPDDDALTYTASSSRTGIVMAVLSGSTVTLTPVTAGTAMVTVTARDPGGLSATQTVAVTVDDAGGTNVCSRTPQVRDAIVAVSPVTTCSALTDAHLAAITELNLHYDFITSLKEGDFVGLSSLMSLRLDDNRLRSLPASVFSGLSSLDRLDLDNNYLRSLPASVFSGLSSLRVLVLGGTNELRSLPDGVFSGLSSLELLDLSNNELRSLPDGVFSELSWLETLYLSNNELRSLPDGVFSGLPLWYLGLNDNELRSLPDGVFSGLSQLRHLRLQDNPVDPLPVTVSLVSAGTGAFKATAHTGAPFNIVVPVSVTNGTIEGAVTTTTVTIRAGRVDTGPLAVTRTPGATGAVTADIGTLPGLPTDADSGGTRSHQGYALVKSADLPLDIATNRAPRATGSIPAQTLTVGGSAVSVNVAQYFTDPDGDALTYTVRSSRTGTAGVAVSGTTVTLTPVAAGSATITVTGRDPGGLSATQAIAVTVDDDGGTNNPDLVVESPSVDENSPIAGAAFTLSATVRNGGDGDAAATTLRYYRSTDPTITTSDTEDTEEGSDPVDGLAASATSNQSVDLTAPASGGTYYYGACVDAVAGESDTANNCSTSVRVDVMAPVPVLPLLGQLFLALGLVAAGARLAHQRQR